MSHRTKVRSPLRAATATWALNVAEWCFRLPAISPPLLDHLCSLTGGPVFGVHYRRVSDNRTLRLAIDHIVRYGGRATGPDHLELRALSSDEKWELARVLGRALRNGTYHPRPHRTIEIPKGPGRGTRPITILCAADRVVQRALVMILQPYLDPQFQPNSLGFRPKRGRAHAVAYAAEQAQRTGNWVLNTEDIQDAFCHVPVRRLMDILRKRVPAPRFLQLVETAITTPGGKGIRQGGALSPLMLNVYLDHVLDRWWNRQHPDIPLIRVADDLLILTSDRDQARQASQALRDRLRPAGLTLKQPKGPNTADLASCENAQWLGLDLQQGRRDLIASIPQEGSCWNALEEKLASRTRNRCSDPRP